MQKKKQNIPSVFNEMDRGEIFRCIVSNTIRTRARIKNRFSEPLCFPRLWLFDICWTMRGWNCQKLSAIFSLLPYPLNVSSDSKIIDNVRATVHRYIPSFWRGWKWLSIYPFPRNKLAKGLSNVALRILWNHVQQLSWHHQPTAAATETQSGQWPRFLM